MQETPETPVSPEVVIRAFHRSTISSILIDKNNRWDAA